MPNARICPLLTASHGSQPISTFTVQPNPVASFTTGSRTGGRSRNKKLTAYRSHREERIIRYLGFGLLNLFLVILFWRPLSMLVSFSLRHDYCSHILLMPLISAGLFRQGRLAEPRIADYSLRAGAFPFVSGIILCWLVEHYSHEFSEADLLSLTTFSLIVAWIGAFVLFYGATRFRTATFPLTLLFLMVPLPNYVLAKSVLALQHGSAFVAYALLKAAGQSVSRDGILLSLPGMTIEIAQECSSIRSSLALFITGLLSAHLLLRTKWTKIGLVALTLPLAVIKNGIRIATLCLLGLYADPGFLTGRLHHEGGVLFFGVALVILTLFLRLLQRSELRSYSPRN